MDARAFERAKNDFEGAQQKLTVMKAAADLQQLVILWSEFLTLIQRVFSKLNKATERGASKGWFDGIKNLRSTDPLLSYIMHARNADEHGIEPITRQEGSGIGIRPREGNSLRINYMEVSPGRIVVDHETAKNIKCMFIPARVTLTSVTDRGKNYPPPTEHLGTPIADPNPISAAELALTFWGRTLAKASEYFE